MNAHLEFLLSRVYSGGALASAHRADLEKSGLSDETIQAQGIRSVPPSMIGPLLGFDLAAINSAMLIPFPAPEGGWMDLVRMKIFPTLTDAAGHSIKYLQPKRTSPRLYFCRAVLERVLRSDEPLWLIEGEKKAMTVAQLGLPAIGICGIEGWHVKGSRDLLEDFTHIPLTGRIVEMVPDGDVATNEAVRRGAERLALALAARGAVPRLVVLPEEVPA